MSSRVPSNRNVCSDCALPVTDNGTTSAGCCSPTIVRVQRRRSLGKVALRSREFPSVPFLAGFVALATLDRCGSQVTRRTLLKTVPAANQLQYILLPGDFHGNLQLEADAVRTVTPAYSPSVAEVAIGLNLAATDEKPCPQGVHRQGSQVGGQSTPLRNLGEAESVLDESLSRQWRLASWNPRPFCPTVTPNLLASATRQPTSEPCRAAPGIAPKMTASVSPALGPFLCPLPYAKAAARSRGIGNNIHFTRE
jgi:hypothetical protein